MPTHPFRPSNDLAFKILGALRMMGHGCDFDDIEELKCIFSREQSGLLPLFTSRPLSLRMRCQSTSAPRLIFSKSCAILRPTLQGCDHRAVLHHAPADCPARLEPRACARCLGDARNPGRRAKRTRAQVRGDTRVLVLCVLGETLRFLGDALRAARVHFVSPVSFRAPLLCNSISCQLKIHTRTVQGNPRFWSGLGTFLLIQLLSSSFRRIGTSLQEHAHGRTTTRREELLLAPGCVL